MLNRPPPGTIPDAAGSYQFKDRHGRLIYVGKAKSLRSRLGSYFQNPAYLLPRTAQMVAEAESVEWIQVDTEVEALMLEYSLIQQHQPRYNVRYRDDKSYPFLCVTMVDEWPRAMVIRGRKRKGNRYFGPYGHAYAIRETLDQLLRTFPIRTCSDNKYNHHGPPGPPVPAVPHREVRRAVRGRGGAGALRRDGGRPAGLSGRRHRRGGEAAGGRHGPGLRRSGVRAGCPLPGPAGQRAQGHRGPGDGGGPLGGLRRGGPGGRRAGGRLPGVLRAQGPGDGPSGVHRGQGGRPGARRAGEPGAGAAVFRGEPAGQPQAGAGARPAPQPGPVRGVAAGAAGVEGGHLGAPAGAEAQAPRDGGPQRCRRLRPPPAPSGPPTTTPGPEPSTTSNSAWACPRPPCGSSATT